MILTSLETVSYTHLDVYKRQEFLCQVMLCSAAGESESGAGRHNAVVLIPQNAEWTKTSEMVREIGTVAGKKVRTVGISIPLYGWAVRCLVRLGD